MRKPIPFHALVASTLTVLIAVGLFLLFRLPATWYHALAAWLVSINLVAFAYYGYDKGQARNSGRRVPELVLHGLVLAGGTLGAYLGMRLFRHKTLKGQFRIFFWVVVVLQVGLVGALLYRIWVVA